MEATEKSPYTWLLACLTLLASSDVQTADNTGKWGSDDELGTLNYITPEVRLHAAKMVRSGQVINVALNLRKGTPTAPGRIFQHSFSVIIPDIQGVGVTDDLITMHQQYSTQWDGFPHFGHKGRLYNNVPFSSVTAGGTRKHSIHQWSDKIVTRGVLLDVARYKGQEFLERGYVITAADLENTAKRQGSKFARETVSWCEPGG